MDGVIFANLFTIIFSIVGAVLTIYKNKHTFTLGSLGVIPSMYLAVYYHNWGSVFGNIIGIAFSVWGWIEWGRNKEE